MCGSCQPTCALDREKLLKETTANATGSGRAPAKYIEVQRQTRNVPRACASTQFCHPLKSPRRGAFVCLVLGGYMLATRCKTMYRWLHGGYMTGKKKNPATELIAGFPLSTW